MIALISPAKNLDETSELPNLDGSTPRLLERSERIMKTLKTKSSRSLQKLMGISKDLGDLNFERNQKWLAEVDQMLDRPAVRMFNGDVYQGMKPWEWAKEDYSFAQKHLLILSGLYGVLKPKDLIKPYRLEMGTQLKIATRKNLYEFWGEKITQKINESLSDSGSDKLINLASKEYYQSVKPQKIKGDIIEISFHEYRNGKYKFISFLGKKARGMMAGFMIKNRITEPEQLKTFEMEGYSFNPKISLENHWIFSRGDD